MDFAQKLGNRIVQLRLARGLSQDELEECACIKQGVISKLENGKHAPQLRTVGLLCQGLRAHPSDVLRDIVFERKPWDARTIPLHEVPVDMDLISWHIGQQLKAARKERSLTQRRNAKLAGISLRTLQRMEGGSAMAHSWKLSLVACSFEVELIELLQLPAQGR